FRYSDPDGNVIPEASPNGSMDNIAGIVNDKGNVMGMMPHPERVSEEILGGTDGRAVWTSIMGTLKRKGAAR
ncbi:MAG: phosphoribosylformylglycinamidine synthase subunit PurQ, partial [Deltaproteobacteria bacterium]|nr:phosphoribosylformylglycinamidine synthase subunit PurQ [Deltaproteobacteria bacterium]